MVGRRGFQTKWDQQLCWQQRSPQHGSPQHGSPQHSSPQQGSPQQGSPQHGSPQQGSPQQSSPQHGSPWQGSAVVTTTVAPPPEGPQATRQCASASEIASLFMGRLRDRGRTSPSHSLGARAACLVAESGGLDPHALAGTHRLATGARLPSGSLSCASLAISGKRSALTPRAWPHASPRSCERSRRTAGRCPSVRARSGPRARAAA
jgi:hypothetical protein